MELEKLNVKFFIAEPCTLPLTVFINVFHGWIQASNGHYYDIADYSHVRTGPGIILIADDANVNIDEAGRRRGLLYSRKRPLPGSNQERLKTVLHAAVGYCRKIEVEPLLEGKIRFGGEQVLVQVNDRLAAPNTDETFNALKPEFEEFFRGFYRGSSCTLQRASNLDQRERFAVLATCEKPFSVADLSEHDWFTSALSESKFGQ